MSVYQWPHKGTTIFRSAISVTVSNIMYICPVLRRVLIYIFFILKAQLFFYSAFRLPVFFSVVKSIRYGSLFAERVRASNGELLLSEVSE